MARRSEVFLTISAHIEVVRVLPILICAPISSMAIVAVLADIAASFGTTVFKQFVPGDAIKVTFRAFVVVRGVPQVLSVCIERAIRPIATKATAVVAC